jgi:Tol biopolymer transport system component
MNIRIAYITTGLLIATCLFFTEAYSQDADVFNLGRIRCYTGGFTLTADDRTIFTAQTYKSNSDSPLRLKIFTSTWSNGQWSELSPLKLNDYHELGPVLSPDGNRLYFSSNSPSPGESDEGDVNIWYVEKEDTQWSSPVFAEGLNSNESDRISFIDHAGKLYLVSARNGNLDVYTSTRTAGGFNTAEPVEAWNTTMDEEYVSLNGTATVAFLQRSKAGATTDILYSGLRDEKWTSPSALNYKDRFTQMPYVHKWPRLSNSGDTFYLISHGLVYQVPFRSIVAVNDLGIQEKNIGAHKPLKIKPRQPMEPEPFGGLVLKTNNGITFTKDGKTAYLSRYTMQRDTFGGQYIKVFESKASKQGWGTPVEAPFKNDQAPYEYHPVVSPDGKKLFYNSRAAKPGSGVAYYPANNVWMVDRLPNGSYSQPEMIDALASDTYDDYASVAKSGTLYFRSDRPGGKGSGDIYRSSLAGGQYQAPENIGDLNSEDNENDVCIDPNEKFIIFNRYIDATKEIKLFLSIRSGGKWTSPRVIEALEKQADWELTPTLSPDGKFFFYEVNSNILRVPVAELFTADEREAMGKG